jgi:hypothetical protein
VVGQLEVNQLNFLSFLVYIEEMKITKTIKTLLIFLPLIFLVGCGPSEEEIREQVRLELEQEKLATQQALEEQKKALEEQKKIQKEEIVSKWYRSRSLLGNLKKGNGVPRAELGKTIGLYRSTKIEISKDRKILIYRDSQQVYWDCFEALRKLSREMGIPQSMFLKISNPDVIKNTLIKDAYENVDIEYRIRSSEGCSIKMTLRLID